MKKNSALLAIMLAKLLTLTGCFNSLEKINENFLIVGTESNFPPFSFKEHNELTGFDIDLIKEVAQRLDKEIIFEDMNFEALIPQTQLGSMHIIAAGMTPTPNRKKVVNFTEPYIHGDSLYIVTLVDRADVGSLEALKQNKRVVVNQGYTADLFMSTVGGPELIRLETPAEAFLALQNNRADAFVTAHNTLAPFFEKYSKDDQAIVPIEETEETTALIVSKKYPELLEQIQEKLDQMEQDGGMKTLKTKWGIHG